MNAFQAELAYKANTIMFFMGNGMIILVSYYLWKVIYGSANSSVISGFNFNEMVIYMLLSFLINTLTSTDITSMIYREVKDGSIIFDNVNFSYVKDINKLQL